MPRKTAKLHALWRAAEVGTPLPTRGRRRACAVYPGPYHVAMANLGYQWLCHALAEAGFAVGRVVWPEPSILDEAERDGPIAIDDDRPARRADVWFVSLSYENDLTRLAGLLRFAGLSTHAAERDAGPLIVAGGVVPMLNPEPCADLADVCLLGEGDAALAPFLEYLRENDAADRTAFLTGLSALQNAYVGRFYEPQFDAGGRLLDLAPTNGFPPRLHVPKEKVIDPLRTLTHVRAPSAAFGDALLVEVGRGCVGYCRFCAAGHLFSPFRAAAAPPALPDRGQTALGLVGSNVSGHPELDRWLGLAGSQRLTLSSIRRGTLTDAQWRTLVAHGLASVALAPEAGTARLRTLCHKPADDDEILAEVQRAGEFGLRNIRLYFMVGLPTETADDVRAIVNLARRCRDAAMIGWKDRRRAGKLLLSVNPFVPKPHTPFQWAAFGDPDELADRIRAIKHGLRGLANVEVQSESMREAVLQALLSTGDRRVAELARLVDETGNVQQALRRWPVDHRALLARQRTSDDFLPWDRIDVGVKRTYLWRQYQDATTAIATES